MQAPPEKNEKHVYIIKLCIYYEAERLTDSVFFDEVDEGGSLDLNWLTVTVIQRQYEVEKVALAKVARRLLLKVCSTQPIHSSCPSMSHNRCLCFK